VNEKIEIENLLNNTKTTFFSLRLAGLSLLLPHEKEKTMFVISYEIEPVDEASGRGY